jgi:cytochrome P450
VYLKLILGLPSFIGANYKRHAALTLPLFRRGKVVCNLDLIVNCTDKLLAKWQASSNQKVHLDIVDQCQNLLLAIFGLIGFDYDLQTLNNDSEKSDNELTLALQQMLSSFMTVIYSPTIIASAYVKLSPQHRRAMKTVRQYFDRMIEKEQAESEESRIQRKRTSLIASLVDSLQKDEQAEARKSDEEKKGKINLLIIQRLN